MLKLSMLDQSPIPKGSTATEALNRTKQLAQLGDELGYHRFWLAEHHSSTSLASSAPEVTAAYIAAMTERIRVGTGGVMVMHYSPYKIAEVFKTISALAPGRVDFGAGRAPGGDSYAMYALAEGRRPHLTEQYDKIEIILNLLQDLPTGERVYDGVVASPTKVPLPEAWLLGSSGQSARQAGELGVGYAFAQFFNGQMTKETFDAYKQAFIPSKLMETPEILVTYAATVAPTQDEAEYLAKPLDIFRLNLMRGNITPTMSPEEAKDYYLTEMDLAMIEQNRRFNLVGTPEAVAETIQQEAAQYGFTEVMLNCNQYAMESRVQTYKLLAEQLLKS